MNETTTKCLAILEKTAGGGYLTPRQRDLVEHGRDGHLNERGERIVDVLYRHICEEQWYFGLEHMTRDGGGNVLFKWRKQDHFSHRWAYTTDARAAAVKIQQACLFLEQRAEKDERQGDYSYLLCDWPMKGKYAEEFARDRQAALDALLNGALISFADVMLDGGPFLLPGWPDEAALYAGRWFDGLAIMEKPENSDNLDISYYLYGKGRPARPATREELDLLESCFEYLSETRQVHSITPLRPAPAPEEEAGEGLER